MAQSEDQTGDLRRSITLPRLVLYGVGTILGAGIFVVIGEVLGEAGRLAPLAYIIAGLVAFATALSYAEISARVPTAGGPIDYIERALGNRHLASGTGWLLMIANTVSAATITSGFIGYLGVFVDVHDWLAALLLVSFLGAIASLGMKASTWFMAITTIIGILTLLAVLWATRDGLMGAPEAVSTTLGDIGAALGAGLFAGAFLAVYSFIGFGDMALTAEEVKDVERTMPRAIIISLAIVFVFYLTISAALIGSGHTASISEARAPLVAAVVREGWPAWPVGIASLFVIINGALTQMIGASRLLMDIGRDERGAPSVFGKVAPKTGTPLPATIAIALIVLLLAAFVPLKSLAEMTSLVILVVFGAVNVSLVVLKRRSQPDDVPDIWIGLPYFGAVTCMGALGTEIWFRLGNMWQ